MKKRKESAQEKVDRITDLLYSELKVTAKEIKRYVKEKDYANALKSKEYNYTCGFLIEQIENDGKL